MGKLQGKRALITGAGTGIGRGIALEFAREGAAVVLHYSHSAAGAASALAEIRAGGGTAHALPADFTDTAAVPRLAEEAVAALGGLDVLVNNAGITLNLPFEAVTAVEFDTLFAVNIRAMFFLTQAALPFLARQKDSGVVNMTSIHAYGGIPEHSVYAATKGAIIAFTRQLAIELAPRGVRVNAIAPGAIEVENYYAADPDFDPASFAPKIPAGFLGQPADVARAAVFLACEDARFITGQTIVVDGGTTSWFSISEGFRQRPGGVRGKGYVPGR
jgi:NAD(P)-dependent dehydrogenase (short-subunit alcohol dehydrogenase family)